MIKSMTGFAFNESLSETYNIACEIKAYNSKTTDVVVRAPAAYRGLEDLARTLLGRYFARGRIEVKFCIENLNANASPFTVDWEKARHFEQIMTEVSVRFNAPVIDKMRLLINNSGMLSLGDQEVDLNAVWAIAEPLLLKSIADLIKMQTNEGLAIARDLSRRLDFLELTVNEVEPLAANLIKMYCEKLKERVKVLTAETVEIDPARLAQEAALLADKADISEEITRALTHIKHFRDLMAAAEPAGRKLNFLLQELNREFNTMGAKIGNADVSYRLVEAKAEIEKIREQVQNVE